MTSGGKERQIKFHYASDIPKVEINYTDATRLHFLFGGDEEDAENVREFLGLKRNQLCKLGIKLASRTSRDLLMLALKCFATKTNLVNSRIINEISLGEGKIFKEGSKGPQQMGDLLLEVESIKREMYYVLQRSQELLKDKETLQTTVLRLEEELANTIESYSQVISEIRKGGGTDEYSTATVEDESNGKLRKKIQALERENNQFSDQVEQLESQMRQKDKEMLKLKDKKWDSGLEDDYKKISLKEYDDFMKLRRDYEILRKNNSSNKYGSSKEDRFSLDYEMKLQELKDENDRLRNRNDGSFIKNASRAMSPNRSGDKESFQFLEGKLNESKKLHEMLVKEVNQLKGKNEELNKENDNLKKGNQKNASPPQRKTARATTDNSVSDENAALKLQVNQLKSKLNNLSQNKQSAKPVSYDNTFELKRQKEALQNEVDDLRKRNATLQYDFEQQKYQQSTNQFTSSYEHEKLKSEYEELKQLYEKCRKDLINQLSPVKIQPETVNFYSQLDVEYMKQQLHEARLLNELYQKEIEDHKAQVLFIATELAKVRQEKDEMWLKLHELESRSPSKSSSNNNTVSQREIDSLKLKVSSLESENDRLRKASPVKSSNMFETNNSALQREIDSLKLKVSSVESENDRLKKASNSPGKSSKIFQLSPIGGGADDLRELREENERLRYENESLLEQRNQLSKKAEGLAKELESRLKQSGGGSTAANSNSMMMGAVGANAAVLDNLMKTNERLIQENANLMEQIETLHDELDNAKNQSRFEYGGGGDDRVRDLERELTISNTEKDRLMVELSKQKNQDLYKRMY
jgi:hypothetical protein